VARCRPDAPGLIWSSGGLGHGGGHISRHCAIRYAVICGPAPHTRCTSLDAPAAVRISTAKGLTRNFRRNGVLYADPAGYPAGGAGSPALGPRTGLAPAFQAGVRLFVYNADGVRPGG